MKKGFMVPACIMWLVMTIGLVSCFAAEEIPFPDVPRTSLDSLKGRLADPSIVVFDVRSPEDWAKSPARIKGAIREDPKEGIAEWSKKYAKNKTYVLYCS